MKQRETLEEMQMESNNFDNVDAKNVSPGFSGWYPTEAGPVPGLEPFPVISTNEDQDKNDTEDDDEADYQEEDDDDEEEDDHYYEDKGFVQGVLEEFTKHFKEEMSPF